MLVVFVFNPDGDRVIEVIWQKADGIVASKLMRDDGSVSETELPASNLVQAIDMQGDLTPTYPADVSDVRSAFMYLGKSADLVETMPEVELHVGSPTRAALGY